MYPPDYDHPLRYQEPSRNNSSKPSTLTPREALEMFQDAVDNAHQGIQQSMAGSGKAGEALKPKLTVDLRSRSLDRIPSEVVAIIKQDVERLHLAHNKLRHIPPEFATCSALKYLNLRDNRFQEIPKAVFGLPQLEILDLSKNKLNVVPEDIDRLKALRVFSIQHNNIEDLPPGLGNINTLRMLKLTGNPLNTRLKRLIEDNESSLSPATPALAYNENEKDTILTKKITEHLRAQSAVRDSGEDSSDGPLETPRAQFRFPVQPNHYGHHTSGSESASDLRSPGFIKPAIPARSHYRVASSQNIALHTAALRRPGLTPLTLGNERNRSNSESILQATQNNKSKRMGMITKKHSDLGVVDETRVNRNSHHFRGQSHGSALRKSIRAEDASPSYITSPHGVSQGTFVRRLSSVPEQKQDSMSTDSFMEGVKGVLYSLHLVHPQMSTLITVTKDGKSKRSSLEKVFHNASTHLEFLDLQLQEYLDLQLHKFDNVERRGNKSDDVSKNIICRATHACIVAYRQIGRILLNNIDQLVRDGDQRYIRTLLLMLYGSLNEARNARRSLMTDEQSIDLQRNTMKALPAIKRVSNEETSARPARSVTPTQERPRPERRWRNGSINQLSISHSNLNSALGAHTAVPSYLNGPSRSNSRARFVSSSTSSSIASTPRSGESFQSTLIMPRSRSSSVTVTSERAQVAQMERDQFEKIFLTLNRAVDQGLEVIPKLEPRFLDRVEVSKRVFTDTRIKELWASLVTRTRYCMETSEALKSRLSAITLNDTEARLSPEFWRVAKKFVNSYGNLLVSLREARVLNLVEKEVRFMLRPVHKSTVEAANLMANSPWNRLTSSDTEDSQPSSQMHSRAPTPVQMHHHPPLSSQAQPPLPTQNGQYQAHRRANGSNGSATSASPYTASVPATPLSAALGPAAQATVPSTPASTMDLSFKGDVFQRAEYLQQTMVRNRRLGT